MARIETTGKPPNIRIGHMPRQNPERSKSKLYKVEFEVELMVLAESKAEAEEKVITRTFDWNDEIQHGMAEATEVTDIRQVLEPDSFPWGGDGDYTCSQFLAQPESSRS